MHTIKYKNLKALDLKQHFKAKGDGETDDSKAIADWLRVGCEERLPLEPGIGEFYTRSPIVVNVCELAGRGLMIKGVGPHYSVFKVDCDSKEDSSFLICCESGDAFHWRISGIGVRGRRNGAVGQIGFDNMSDPHNSFKLVDCAFNNDYVLKGREQDRIAALRVNFTCQGVIDVIANGGLQRKTDAKKKPEHRKRAGTALELRRAQFCRITGSFGHARHGIKLIDGDTFGCHVDTMDNEENLIGVGIYSDTAQNNKFTAGTIASNNGWDAAAGHNNVIEAVNNGCYPNAGQWIMQDKGLVDYAALFGNLDQLIEAKVQAEVSRQMLEIAAGMAVPPYFPRALTVPAPVPRRLAA